MKNDGSLIIERYKRKI